MTGGARAAEETGRLWAEDEGAALELRKEAAARLAAHRARRGGQAQAAAVEGPRVVRKRSAVAEAVAERYAHSPSYRAYLAAEAEAATQRAAAAAEVAARNAQAIARAEEQLKEELELWPRPETGTAGEVNVPPEKLNEDAGCSLPMIEQATGKLTVRLYEDLGMRRGAGAEPRGNAGVTTTSGLEEMVLDEEIAFRQAPVFAEAVPPPVLIPGNLLEFPRQLVAARKARPVLALGPLRESTGPAEGQLRIFEVEPQQINAEPPVTAAEPEWRSIWLDAPLPQMSSEPEVMYGPIPLDPAPVSRRAMALTLDCILILEGFLLFAAVFGSLASSLDLGVPLAVAGAGTLVVFTVMYYVLFFLFSEQTPGMRYARIGLCTFSDENPTRRAMRRRLMATLVAVCPLGLGLLWALLDEDKLGWHDRISRMYQRSY